MMNSNMEQTPQKEFYINSKEEMWELAARFVSFLLKNKYGTAFALSGDLGAGKTTFIQGVAQALGITSKVTSPTFVIERRYTLPKPLGMCTTLIHIDAYRLSNGEETDTFHFKDTCNDEKNLIFIEWPEKIASALPSKIHSITFEHLGSDSRRVVFDTEI